MERKRVKDEGGEGTRSSRSGEGDRGQVLDATNSSRKNTQKSVKGRHACRSKAGERAEPPKHPVRVCSGTDRRFSSHKAKAEARTTGT